MTRSRRSSRYLGTVTRAQLDRAAAKPVDPAERCFMGAPLGAEFHCVNRAADDSLFCVECQADNCPCAACALPFNEATA